MTITIKITPSLLLVDSLSMPTEPRAEHGMLFGRIRAGQAARGMLQARKMAEAFGGRIDAISRSHVRLLLPFAGLQQLSNIDGTGTRGSEL